MIEIQRNGKFRVSLPRYPNVFVPDIPTRELAEAFARVIEDTYELGTLNYRPRWPDNDD